MRSYTQSITLLQQMNKIAAGDTETTAFLTTLYNDSLRTIYNIRGGKWYFLEKERGIITTAGVGLYAIPTGIRKVVDLTSTVGTTRYRPTPVYDSKTWNDIKTSNIANSDVTLYYFVQDGYLNIYPPVATSTPFLTLTGRVNTADLGVADSAVTAVVTVTSGLTTITSSTSIFNASMVGKYIKIGSTGVVGGGDNRWYKIVTFSSATSVVIGTTYEGTSISAVSNAVTIAEMTLMPEAYDMAPMWRTTAIYSQINDPTHPEIAKGYWRLYDGGQEAGLSNSVGGILGQMLENEGASIEDVYMSPYDRVTTDPNTPPRYPLTGM